MSVKCFSHNYFRPECIADLFHTKSLRRGFRHPLYTLIKLRNDSFKCRLYNMKTKICKIDQNWEICFESIS